jgi:hypothetical protein
MLFSFSKDSYNAVDVFQTVSFCAAFTNSISIFFHSEKSFGIWFTFFPFAI